MSGAITDTSWLRGKIARVDILPNEQLTAADFVGATTDLHTPIAPHRAVVVTPTMMMASVTAGSRVDVWIIVNGKSRKLPDMHVLGTSAIRHCDAGN